MIETQKFKVIFENMIRLRPTCAMCDNDSYKQLTVVRERGSYFLKDEPMIGNPTPSSQPYKHMHAGNSTG